MIDSNTKQTILSDILQSDEFKTSKINKKLLTYLVEASIRNEKLKEYTIASDVFCKDANFIGSEDPIVRVSIHNLRTKLEKYYQKEGRKSTIKIEIPKGHYEVEFVHKKKEKIITTLFHTQTILYFIIGSLLFTLIFILYQYFLLKKQIELKPKFNKNNLIWSNFLSSNYPKLIVLGDHFFFVDSLGDQNEKIIVRKETINSYAEFEEYKLISSKKNLRKLQYPLFAMNSIWPLPNIVCVLERSGIKFSMKYASIVNSSDLKTYDVIFVGSFQTLALLNQALKNSKISYEIKPKNKIILKTDIKDTSVSFIREGTPDYDHTDYCFVRKLPGPNNNTILMFISFHATGTTGAVNYLTHDSKLKELEQILLRKFGSVPPYFDIIFKSSGYARVVFSTEIKYIAKLQPENIKW